MNHLVRRWRIACTLAIAFLPPVLIYAQYPCPGGDNDLPESISLLEQDSSHLKWRIDGPGVKGPRKEYSNIIYRDPGGAARHGSISFRPYDEVVVQAGGCVQTGGHGDTWKRYVNPSGNASDRLYHGKLSIPGATAGLVRISSITRPYRPEPLHLVVNKLPPHYDGSPLYLQLGYEDDDYGDNGYYKHDDGNDSQCRCDRDGGPAWIVITIIHHSLIDAPASPLPQAPMDLWWTSIDDNFLPLNPAWGAQQESNNWAPPNSNSICKNFHNENDGLPMGKSRECTLWDPEVNERGFFSLCLPSSNTVAGHINWAAATYTGRIFFKDFSGGFPQDADYNFILIGETSKGVTTPTEFNVDGKEGIGIEFSSRETVDAIQGTGEWWDRLHSAVDHDQQAVRRFFTAQPREAIVIGLLGLDHAHAAHAELHPAYGLAIHIEDTPEGDVWAILGRNWGDEGSCSQQLELLALRNNRLSFFIPKPRHTTISESGSRFHRLRLDSSGYDIQNRDDGVILSRHLGSPENRGLFYGELHLKKEKADLSIRMTASPNPVVTGSSIQYTITVTNNGPDTARAVSASDPRHTRLIGALLPGTARTVTWSDTADCSLADGASITNQATVVSLTQDLNLSNNLANTTVTASNPSPVITPPPDVTVYTGVSTNECGKTIDDAALGTATVTDNCPGASLVRTGVPPKNFFPVGTTVITFTSIDSGGARSTATQKVTMIDNTPPVIIAPPVTAYTGPGATVCGAVVSDDTLAAKITDNCSGVSFERSGVPAGNLFLVGVSTVTYVGTDAHGNISVARQSVTVVDNTPPVIRQPVVDRPVLFPANHQMTLIRVDYAVGDNCPLPQAPCEVTVISDEPDSGTGAGDLAPDWTVLDEHTLYVRSERSSLNRERVYTITVTCRDTSGNVATAKTSVVVAASVPAVEVERTEQSDFLDNRLIENLPNLRRDALSYVNLLPGVFESTSIHPIRPYLTFSPPAFYVGGSVALNSLGTIDGGENTNGSGQIRLSISPEAVSEIQVFRSSYQAQYGFSSGAIINAVSRSGTSDFHISENIFYRSRNISARNPLDFSPTRPNNRFASLGFTFSGPLMPGKMFLFSNDEHSAQKEERYRTYSTSPLLTPSSSQAPFLNMLDSTGKPDARRIAANLRNALTTSASTYPLTWNLLQSNQGSFNSSDRLDTWLTRLDYQPSNRDSLSGRFSWTRARSSDIGPLHTLAPTSSEQMRVRDYTTLFTWVHEFKVNLSNVQRVQLSPGGSAEAIPNSPDSPSVIILDLAAFGRPYDAPLKINQNRLQFEDVLTWLRNDHTFKFGFSNWVDSYKVRNELWFSGEWLFSPGTFPVTLAVPEADRAAFLTAVGKREIPALSGLQSFNLNLPSLYRQGFHDPFWSGTANYLGLFAQDTAKVRPNLTLDYGSRVDWFIEADQLPDNLRVSPRLGFAWDVTSKHKTVVRGGAGVFYSPFDLRVGFLAGLLNRSGLLTRQILKTDSDLVHSPSKLWAAGLALGKLPFKQIGEADLNALGVLTGPEARDRVVSTLDPGFTHSYTVHSSLGIQHQIAKGLGVDIAYLMYRGLHLPKAVETNYRESSVSNPLSSQFGPQYERVDPALAQVINFESTGKSVYHAMVVSIAQRASAALQFSANYTFSSAIDYQNDFNPELTAAFPTRLFLDKAISSFHVRHSLIVAGIFQSQSSSTTNGKLVTDFLSNLILSPVLYIRSGIPFTLRTGADINGDTHALNDRLFFVGRDTGIGPYFYSVDLRLKKLFLLGGENRPRIEFITDINNLFNHANFASVNDVIGPDPTAADYNIGSFRLKGLRTRQITEPLGFNSAFEARRIQFGVKFIFK